jgi:uncharacterized protein YraI
MKFFFLLATALLPTGLLAAPAAGDKATTIEAEAHAAAEARAAIEAREAVSSLENRAVQACEIVGGASRVNCRSGPGTNYGVVRSLPRGEIYGFSCVKSGECVVIGGATNWSVLPTPVMFMS